MASQFAFQTGGMVPTLLEPGEKVFMPGQWGPDIEALNTMVPRFQEGGQVDNPNYFANLGTFLKTIVMGLPNAPLGLT